MFFSLLLQQQPSPVLQFAPYLLIGLVFYFLLFRPMQKQKKQQQEMVSQLKSGDSVITTGGITGTVVSVDSDTIVLRVKPDNVKLQFARSAVTTVTNAEGTK
ncbi:MAG: preprotein translocase subunit YajC [Acidobacteriia bacterium]|nr:preprotein translocase subunit YajC [Terriglobia bacterium]